MPEKKFSLEVGGPQRLIVSWSGLWNNFQVQLDGRTLGTIEGGTSAIKAGKEFALGDGTTLKIQLTTGAGSELQILRDGRPVPGSSSDPAERLKVAGGIIYFIAALSAGCGLIALLVHVEFLLQMGVGAGSVITGIFYGGLGYLVRERRSKIALGLAMSLFALEGVMMMAANSGHFSGMIMRGLFLMQMYKGFAAIDALNEPVPARVSVAPSAVVRTPSAAASAVCAFCGLPLKPEETVQSGGKNRCRNCSQT